MYRINCELEEYRVRSINTTLLKLYSGVHRIGTPKVGILLHLHFWVPSSFFSYSERRYRNLWIRDWIVERSRPADEVCTSSEKELNLLLALQSAQGTPTTFHFEACRCCRKGLSIVSAGWLLAANAISNTPEARSTVQVRNRNNESQTYPSVLSLISSTGC